MSQKSIGFHPNGAGTAHSIDGARGARHPADGRPPAPAAGYPGRAPTARCEIDSKICDTIANDPPQPFHRIVHFERQASVPPGSGSEDRAVAALAIASQHAFFFGVTAAGALAAAERLAGATAAADYDWSVTHQGVLRQATARLPVDLALVAAAQRAAGLAIEETAVDVKLSPGQKGAGEWIADPANEAGLSRSLERTGHTTKQIAEGIAWMRSDPPYQGQPATVSAQLVLLAGRMYRAAERLAAHP